MIIGNFRPQFVQTDIVYLLPSQFVIFNFWMNAINLHKFLSFSNIGYLEKTSRKKNEKHRICMKSTLLALLIIPDKSIVLYFSTLFAYNFNFFLQFFVKLQKIVNIKKTAFGFFAFFIFLLAKLKKKKKEYISVCYLFKHLSLVYKQKKIRLKRFNQFFPCFKFDEWLFWRDLRQKVEIARFKQYLHF